MLFNAVLHTMIIFFAILLVGFVAGKAGVIKRDFMPGFASLVTKVLLPCLIFYATVTGCTRQAMADNLPLLGLAASFYAFIVCVTLALAKALRMPVDKGHVFMFCFIFGNTGFVGIPLLSAVFPDLGLLYLSLFSIVDTPVFWTLGVWLATPRGRRHERHEAADASGGSAHSVRHMARSVLDIVLTPNIIAMVLAFAFVLAEWPLPDLLGDVLSTIASSTSAMCMIYLGALLCFSDFMSAFKSKEFYVGVAVKMVLVPCCIGALLHLTPLPSELVTSITLLSALPTMTIVPMIASQRGDFGDYAAGITVGTLVFSLVTIPLVTFLVL
ncbi:MULTISPECIES: AEC family transporter [unclassified Adlercreutzia]|uniref:AEC family transporter n=1 Tax=unclassified Adlercreutzia TaxID=2636013 RepID=UPI0013EC609C|nr:MULTISPECIES: AEC family transporter [unclassified Adlercreutzia]